MPSISVITTTFNETPKVFERAVLSIFNQTFTDWDYWIYPGNPDNKELLNYLNELKSQFPDKINLIIGDKREKSTVCMNEMIKRAKSPLIAIQEADDESLPERLAKQFRFMNDHPQADASSPAVRYVDEYSNETLLERFFPYEVKREIYKYQAINTAAAIIRKDTFEKYGYFDPSLGGENALDYEFWLRIITKGAKLYNLNEILFKYIQSNDNGRNRFPKKALKATINAKLKYSKVLGFDLTDYFYILMEYTLLLFPSSFIRNIFYDWYRLKMRIGFLRKI